LQGNVDNVNDLSSFDEEGFIFCENLYDCFFTFINFGLRSGGGIGDELARLP
jgi:hypothetical protein